MSLEIKIEILTKSIDALNANIAKLVNVPCADDPVLAGEILDREMPKELAKKEQVKAEVLTHESIQASLMVIVRKNTKSKPKIKALLSGFSASKVSDLAEADLEEFKSAIENL